ncbi:hypothetical protein Droror1_Dr00026978 [Drosera rotundifolia]
MEFDDDYDSLIPEEKSPSLNRGLKLKSLKKGEGGGKRSGVRVRVRNEMLSMRRGRKREVMIGGEARLWIPSIGTWNSGQEISVLCQNVVGFLVFIVPGFGSIAIQATRIDLRKLSESISLRRTGSVEANEKFLLRLKSRLDRVGIDIPKIEVRFEHLEVEAEAYVGSKALPSFLNFTTSIFELSRREKEANIKPDPDLDLFMKAGAGEGQEESVITDYMLKVLGLEVCVDTMVGDNMLRGISGGQKKRVTTGFSSTGEMLVGPAKVLFMDEISIGLASSTTFQIVNSLRQYVHILDGTTVISFLQPTPETYVLFDDIILLSDGLIVYQGPRESVLEFFEEMGFRCPEREGVSYFLQEVTSRKDQEQYWTLRDIPYRFITANEFAEALQSFHVYQTLRDEHDTLFDRSKNHPAALTTDKYGVENPPRSTPCV